MVFRKTANKVTSKFIIALTPRVIKFLQIYRLHIKYRLYLQKTTIHIHLTCCIREYLKVYNYLFCSIIFQLL